MTTIIFFVVFIGIILGVVILNKWSASRGKLNIVLEKSNSYFSVGEVIKGKIVVELKKPIQADKLEVRLQAEKTITGTRNMNRPSFGGTPGQPNFRQNRIETSEEVISLYDFPVVLGQEGEYLRGEYPFELVVPDLSTGEEKLSGLATSLLDFANKFGVDRTVKIINWYVFAGLSIPKAIDLENFIEIQVAPKQGN